MRKFCILLTVMTALVFITACHAEEATGSQLFEEEYEILNGQTTMDGEHTYSVIDVPSENRVEYADLAQIQELLATGTGVIYFGFPECPWCRTLVPVLFEATAAAGYEGPVYYSNFLSERDKLKLDDSGKIVVEQEGTEAYQQLVATLYDWLGPYNGLNDDSIKRIYFPTTVFVRNGQIVDVHLVTVESQESGYDPLTDEQHAELLSTLTTDIQSIIE
jgi:hypothetical protein